MFRFLLPRGAAPTEAGARALARRLRATAREPGSLLAHLATSPFAALVAGVVYFDVDDRLTGIQNRAGLFFASVLYHALGGLSAVADASLGGESFERREVASGVVPAAIAALSAAAKVNCLRIMAYATNSVAERLFPELHTTNTFKRAASAASMISDTRMKCFSMESSWIL